MEDAPHVDVRYFEKITHNDRKLSQIQRKRESIKTNLIFFLQVIDFGVFYATIIRSKKINYLLTLLLNVDKMILLSIKSRGTGA